MPDFTNLLQNGMSSLTGKIEKAVLGSMHRYDRKLRKFRTFLQNRPPDIQEKNYTEYDLRFKGQVIGRY